MIFKIIRSIIFYAVKKVSLPQSRKFFLIKEFFHSQGTFTQTRKFTTVKELFLDQETFPQSRNFSTVKELLHSHESFSQKFLLDQGSFQQTKIFIQSKWFSRN